jgi:methyltransferase (TIGR00027 family)
VLRTAARLASLGLVDHAALRMHAIDDAVRDAAREGVSQLVVLGAGLDARPWRMEELASVDVIEIDHPATQSYKRERIAGRKPLARSHRFAPVDFERDDLGERLDQEGLDRTRPTLWLWEAVAMYLGPSAIEATLDQIGARSAPGSRLALTYITPSYVPIGLTPKLVTDLAFRVLGEPITGTMTPEEVTAKLARHRYRVLTDTSSVEWAAKHGGSALLSVAFRGERLAVAVREP